MKKRWISLALILALLIAACSVFAAAADAQEEPAADTAEAVQTEEVPADGSTDANTDAAEEQVATGSEPDAAAAEAPAAQDGETHIHAVNREDACEEAAFLPLETTGGKLEAGCYYLTDDLALTEPLCVPKGGVQVTLCLNGHTLSLADGAEGCIIYLAVGSEDEEPSSLMITDCNGAQTTSNYYVDEDGALVFDDGSFAWQEAYIAASEKNVLSGGRLTGATAGAVSAGDYSQLYLTNVNIIDNEGRYGAGVVIAEHAEAVIDSCVIAGNRLTGEMKTSERSIAGGGIYCAGTLELFGMVNVTGNRAQDTQNNLWLDEAGSLTIGTSGLDAQSHIGVSGSEGQTLLTGYADDFSACFTSDNQTLAVAAAQKNGFTSLSLEPAVYTLTLDLGDAGQEPVTLEPEQGQTLEDLNVQDPVLAGSTFAGWYLDGETPIDTQQPLHLTQDTTLYAHWSQGDTAEDTTTVLTYDPEKPITKEEAVKTLYRMALQLGLDTEAAQEVDLSQFADADTISGDTADAVRWAYDADLLTEKNGSLHLTDTLSQKGLSRMLEDFLALTQD